jgi:hypothetical protein
MSSFFHVDRGRAGGSSAGAASAMTRRESSSIAPQSDLTNF